LIYKSIPLLMQPILSERYDQALVYARQLHQQQIRKGTDNAAHNYYGLPYFSHVMAVSSLVLEYQGTEAEAIAALLHDALEDGPQYSGKPITQIRQEIARQFGQDVLQWVEGCTQSNDKGLDWWQRKQAYLDQVPHKSFSVLLLSAADKFHNASTIVRDLEAISDRLWQRFSHGKAGVLWYYSGLATTLSQAAAKQEHERAVALQRLTTQLQHVVERIEAIA
jgi:GTP pyrophosphokinase